MNNDQSWWLKEKYEAHDKLYADLGAMYPRLLARQRFYREMLDFYEYGEVRLSHATNLFSPEAFLPVAPTERRHNPVNIVKGVVSAAISAVIGNNARCEVLTEDGNFSLRRQAKDMSMFFDGVFHHQHLVSLADQIMLDAGICGNGILKPCIEGDEIILKRVAPWRFFIDELATPAGTDPSVYLELIYTSCYDLIDMYKDSDGWTNESESVIMSHRGVGFQYDSTNTTSAYASDLVAVVLATKMGYRDKPGRQVACIPGLTLMDTEYTRKTPPYLIVNWSTSPRSVLGSGIVELVTECHRKFNRVLLQITENLEVTNNTHVLIERGSIQSDQLDAFPGSVWQYSGAPPNVIPPPNLPSSAFDFVRWCHDLASRLISLSQVTATGLTQSDRTSGKARLMALDIEQRGLISPSLAYQNIPCLLANQIVDLCKNSSNANIKTIYVGRKKTRPIKWSDVDMDRDKFILKAWPTALFPTTPTGKLQILDELNQMQVIPQKEFIRFIDFPDVQGYLADATASVDLIDSMVEAILYNGESIFLSDIDLLDPNEVLSRAIPAYHRARIDGGYPEGNLDLLLDFIQSAQDAIIPAPTPSAAPPSSPGDLSDVPPDLSAMLSNAGPGTGSE